ncbi:hypothetical protein [Nocardia sp. NPDC004722]
MAKIEVVAPPSAYPRALAYRYEGREILLEHGDTNTKSGNSTFRIRVDGQPIPTTLVRISRGYKNSKPNGYRYSTEPAAVEWIEIPNKLGFHTLRQLASRDEHAAPQLAGTLSEGRSEMYNTVAVWEDKLDITFAADLSSAEVVVNCFMDDAT